MTETGRRRTLGVSRRTAAVSCLNRAGFSGGSQCGEGEGVASSAVSVLEATRGCCIGNQSGFLGGFFAPKNCASRRDLGVDAANSGAAEVPGPQQV